MKQNLLAAKAQQNSLLQDRGLLFA